MARNGSAESTWPNCPQMPVSWLTSGIRRSGNQYGTSRSTEMKVKASPSPSTARAAIAAGRVSDTASANCPAAIRMPPVTIIVLDPTRSSSSPAGTWAAAYTTTCSTTNVDSTPGLAPKRWAASRPDTPSEVRSSTATT